MKITQENDQVLVRQYLDGNNQSFEILINKYEKKLYSYILLNVKEACVAEDIFQDTFIKIINTLKSGKYNEEGKFLQWMFRIAHNLIIDHFRAKKRHKIINNVYGEDDELDLFNIIPNNDINSEEDMIKTETNKKIKQLIQELPEEQKEVLILRHYVDMSFKEIANFTNVSINTSLGRMRYALINLKKLIKEKEPALLT